MGGEAMAGAPLEPENATLEEQVANLTEQLAKYRVREKAEADLLQSPLYKFGKWVISTVVLAGIIIWVGGSVYSGVQIKSIRDQSNETLSEIRTLAYSVSEANEKVRAFLT